MAKGAFEFASFVLFDYVICRLLYIYKSFGHINIEIWLVHKLQYGSNCTVPKIRNIWILFVGSIEFWIIVVIY